MPRLLRHLAPLALLLAVIPASLRAQSAEYQIKAAMIYNFAKFVEWPADALAPAPAPLTLCVLGRDPFGGALAAIEGRSAQGRELRVRRGLAADEFRGCHLLFIADSEERRLPALLRTLANQPVLAVSDIEGFAEAGGTIALIESDGRLQFEINLGAAQRANLKISSQLLRLAKLVRDSKGKS